jgi:hypothetical protein
MYVIMPHDGHEVFGQPTIAHSMEQAMEFCRKSLERSHELEHRTHWWEPMPPMRWNVYTSKDMSYATVHAAGQYDGFMIKSAEVLGFTELPTVEAGPEIHSVEPVESPAARSTCPNDQMIRRQINARYIGKKYRPANPKRGYRTGCTKKVRAIRRADRRSFNHNMSLADYEAA